MAKENTDKREENKELNELKQKVDELENNWKRALADYINLQKRVAEEKEQTIKFANQIIILKLLFVLDNLEMLQDHIKDEGLDMIVKQFRQVLTEEGVEEIDCENTSFDHTKMEAVEVVEGDNDRIVEVVQKGYSLRNKILRPAKVKVGKSNES